MTTAFVLLCGVVAVALGEIHLFAAGAPRRYLLVNAAALAVGLVIVTLARSVSRRAGAVGDSRRHVTGATAGATAGAATGTATVAVTGVAIVGVGLCLLAVALLTDPVDGASRWIRIGGLSLQPSLILLPAALFAFARQRGAVAAIGLSIAAVALALQPDRAMAGTLAAGLAALWIVRREPAVTLACLTALASFAATLLRPDNVPPVRFVEQVVRSSFAQHPLIGATVIAGLVVMLLPAASGAWRDAADRDTPRVFGSTWLAIIVAALLGNYPTPLVGAGSSAILGYCLGALAAGRDATRPQDPPVFS